MSDSIAALQAHREALRQKRQAKLGQTAAAAAPATPAPPPLTTATSTAHKRPREEAPQQHVGANHPATSTLAHHMSAEVADKAPAEKRARAMEERRRPTSASPSPSPSPALPAVAAVAPPPAAVYSSVLNIPAEKVKDGHVPEHWRAHDTTDHLTQDYSQHFVNRGSLSDRPTNFIRNETEVDQSGGDKDFAAYLRRSAEVVAAANMESPYMAKRVDLSSSGSPDEPSLVDLLDVEGGTEFDVILIDPPWQEYKDRSAAAHLTTSHHTATSSATSASARVWSAEEVARLPIPQLAAEPCILFLWCGAGKHVAEAHELLRTWGFHKIEDIVWLQTNRSHPTVPGYTDGEGVFQRTFEHCLVALKGQEWILRDRTIASVPYLQRMELGLVQFLHPGVDIDCLVSEVDQYGDTRKPEAIYHLIERYCQGRRRLELFGTDDNIRNGWITLGLDVSPEVEKFDMRHWRARFEQPVKWTTATNGATITRPTPLPFDARVGGRYLPFDGELEQLRPKSPPNAQHARKMHMPGRKRRGWNLDPQVREEIQGMHAGGNAHQTATAAAAAGGAGGGGAGSANYTFNSNRNGPNYHPHNNHHHGSSNYSSHAAHPHPTPASASNPSSGYSNPPSFRSPAASMPHRYAGSLSPPFQSNQAAYPSAAAYTSAAAAASPAASTPPTHYGRMSTPSSMAMAAAPLPTRTSLPLPPLHPAPVAVASHPHHSARPARSLSPQPLFEEPNTEPFAVETGSSVQQAYTDTNTIWR